VARLRRLLRFTNPREDMVQLLRNTATDLELFGDAYIEIVTLLGEPVALYTLDATTMTVIADQHGEVTGYVQDVDGVRTASFDPDQVIHISLDAPRGGLYGVSPAQKALLPVTAWLFTMATLKECFRRGDPPRLHVDLQHFQDTDVQRWREQYRVFNLGPKAVGEPVVTTGGGIVGVLDQRKVTDYLDADRQLRDQIIAAFGVPPAKLGIIETGNLGGGTGESQDKTFRVNTVIPVANLILEKLNFHLVQQGFGIEGWNLEFGEIDYRDSKVIEEIRDTRLRNGAYTLNRYRDEIGEGPVDGGDDPVLVDRQNLVLWADMARMSEAVIAKNAAPGVAAGVQVNGVQLAPQPEPDDSLPPDPPSPPDQLRPPPEDEPEPEESADWDLAYERFLCEQLARL
jgi:HK97 family phage portal protein